MEELRQRAVRDGEVPPEAVAYAAKVRQHAYKVVDRDIEDLKAAGWSEDRIFELTVGLAVDEGMRRLDAARQSMGS